MSNALTRHTVRAQLELSGNQQGGYGRPIGMSIPLSISALPPVRFAACLAMLSLLIAACGSSTSTAAGSGSDGGSSSSSSSDYDGTWTLIDGEIDGVPFVPVPNYPITLEIDGDLVRGNAGCNGFGGGFAADGAALTLSDVSITEMACADQAPMEAEQTFIQAFWQLTTIELVGAGTDERLVLSAEGATLNYSRDAPTPEAALIGTAWILDTFIQGDAASSTVNGAELSSLFLGDDGWYLVLTGCRELTGPYLLDGDRLTLSIDIDDFACEGATGEQDTQVLAVLDQPMTLDIDENRLTAMADDGINGLSYQAEG